MLDRHIITGFNKSDQQLDRLETVLVLHQLKAAVIEEVLRGAGILTEEAFEAAKKRLQEKATPTEASK